MSLVADLALRSSAILLAGLALHACLRRRSAALRHFVLTAALVATAAAIPLRFVAPDWEVAPRVSLATPVQPADPVAVTVGVGAVTDRTPVVPVSRFSTLGIGWFAGFIGTATLLLAGLARSRRIARRARRVQDAAWVTIAADIASAYGIKRQILILQTAAPDVLATWGVRRPRVVLPSHARDWSPQRLHVVLSHELAHIRRHDWIVQIGAETLRTLLWFNPLMWITCTRLRREAELACDDAVLERGVPARDYAGHLLDLARKCRRPGFTWASAVPMAHPSTLERRITAMLNSRVNRQALSRRAIAAIAALLTAVTLPAASLRAVQSGPAMLTGSIYDPSGAVLPGVELTLEDANQVKWTAVSDASGRFEFPAVHPGRYVIGASLAGFRTLRQPFELAKARDWDRAVMLQVGAVQETISVRESRVAPAQTASQPAASPLRVGGNIRAPRKLTHVRPVYPAAMRAAGREGVVPLEAIIGLDGTVTSVRVISAQVHPDFAIAAADAVRQWRFSPTLLNGVPVEVVMTVTVTFDLAD